MTAATYGSYTYITVLLMSTSLHTVLRTVSAVNVADLRLSDAQIATLEFRDIFAALFGGNSNFVFRHWRLNGFLPLEDACAPLYPSRAERTYSSVALRTAADLMTVWRRWFRNDDGIIDLEALAVAGSITVACLSDDVNEMRDFLAASYGRHPDTVYVAPTLRHVSDAHDARIQHTALCFDVVGVDNSAVSVLSAREMAPLDDALGRPIANVYNKAIRFTSKVASRLRECRKFCTKLCTLTSNVLDGLDHLDDVRKLYPLIHELGIWAASRSAEASIIEVTPCLGIAFKERADGREISVQLCAHVDD